MSGKDVVGNLGWEVVASILRIFPVDTERSPGLGVLAVSYQLVSHDGAKKSLIYSI